MPAHFIRHSMPICTECQPNTFPDCLKPKRVWRLINGNREHLLYNTFSLLPLLRQTALHGPFHRGHIAHLYRPLCSVFKNNIIRWFHVCWGRNGLYCHPIVLFPGWPPYWSITGPGAEPRALIYGWQPYNAMTEQGDNDTSVKRGSAIEKAERWEFYEPVSHGCREGISTIWIITIYMEIMKKELREDV